MTTRARYFLLLLVATVGCHTLTEEMPTGPSRDAADSPLVTLPVVVQPVPLPTPSTPAPTPAPTPTPDPGPTPTPDPAPTPTSQPCGGMDITIDGSCGGSTPDCGITNSKAPEVAAARAAKVVLDASYYLNNPWNKVHDYDACYPGPMSGWTNTTGVSCTEPYSNNHVMTCGPFTTPGSYSYRVCGAGICRSITVTVR